MSFDDKTRGALSRMVEKCRTLLSADIRDQMQAIYGLQPDGSALAIAKLGHLDEQDKEIATALREWQQHLASIESGPESKRGASAFERAALETSFTVLNRLAALRMCEERGHVTECVRKGMASDGFRLFEELSGGLVGNRTDTYRFFLERMFDELAVDLGVLFDLRAPQSLVFPRERCLEGVLAEVNDPDLAHLWALDETIGWIYQYFNSKEERQQMRKQSAAPQNSRELAVRNQFFTPRYVVEFLVDNTLGRIWYEMRRGDTRLEEKCRYLVRPPLEVFLGDPVQANQWLSGQQEPSCKIPEPIAAAYRGDLCCIEEDLGPLERWIAIAIPPDQYSKITGEKYNSADGLELLDRIWEAIEKQPESPVLNDVLLLWTALSHFVLTSSGSPYDREPFAKLWNALKGALRQQPPKELSQEELLRSPVYISYRAKKDPRDLKILDPAVGSGHFLLYAFDLLQVIYEESWTDAESPAFPETKRTLHDDYPDIETLRRHLPDLILRHNLHGIDIDLRACQIAALALWLRAQRAWQDQGLKLGERPQVRRSNIVCAEAMPGEPEMLDEFASQLQPKVLGQLVRRVFEEMKLAGEAGSLLKIEEEIAGAVAEAKKRWLTMPQPEQGRLFGDSRPVQKELSFDFTGITDEAFWEEAEDRIYAELQNYAEKTEYGGSYQRQLFADDAARGFALIDLCRKRYDAVLMNPPFGLSQGELYSYLNREYPDSFIDLLASFIVRAERLAPSGLVGAITSRACLYTKTLLKWRTNHLSGHISALADMGIGVLDGAMVRACAYVIPVGRPRVDGCFVDARRLEDKEAAILAGLDAMRNATPGEVPFYFCNSEFFALIPQRRILYWLPRDFWQTIKSLPPIEPLAATIRAGLTTYDDFRFLRLRWEVFPSEIGAGNRWMFLSKGGYFGTFYNDVHLVVLWTNGGREVGAYNRSLYNTDAQSRRGSAFYLRPAVTYSRRTDFFSARVLPQNCFFADKGPAIIPLGETTPAYLLGLFNSDLFRGLVHSQSQGGCFETGVLKLLPWSQPSGPETEFVEMAANAAWRTKASVFALLELDARFISPLLFPNPSLGECRSPLIAAIERANASTSAKATEISGHVSRLFGLGSDRFEDLDVFETDHEIKDAAELIDDPKEFIAAIMSYILGVCFGRWDIRFASCEMSVPELPDPFAPLPACPPGRLLNEHGLPLTQDDVEYLWASGKWNYPIEIPWQGILVDDPGHSLDIEARVRPVFEFIWGNHANAIEQEACEILGCKSLREYYCKHTGFFANHLKRYSKSHRQAPIYWPLSTESGSYTLWFYYDRLNGDILYTALNKFVKPKIDEIERRLRQIEAELPSATGREASKLREEFEESGVFLAELIDFRDELLRVAGLPYKPDLNDGVLITASPLWKVFRQPKWRKDLKECWEALEAGDYDWAHLAHSIWPERVREACKEDLSIAIAHGLEELCEIEQKPKKKARQKKLEPQEELET